MIMENGPHFGVHFRPRSGVKSAIIWPVNGLRPVAKYGPFLVGKTGVSLRGVQLTLHRPRCTSRSWSHGRHFRVTLDSLLQRLSRLSRETYSLSRESARWAESSKGRVSPLRGESTLPYGKSTGHCTCTVSKAVWEVLLVFRISIVLVIISVAVGIVVFIVVGPSIASGNQECILCRYSYLRLEVVLR